MWLTYTLFNYAIKILGTQVGKANCHFPLGRHSLVSNAESLSEKKPLQDSVITVPLRSRPSSIVVSKLKVKGDIISSPGHSEKKGF